MPSVLCSLEVNDFGNPPRCFRIEARKLPQGFDAWFCDEHLCPEGTVIATRDCDYNARSFCPIISECRLRYPLNENERPPFQSPADVWRRVNVTGERGLKAHMLAVAFMTDYSAFPSWLQQQSDASFAFLEGIVGETIEGDWETPLAHIRITTELRKLDGDVLSLLRRYDLPASAANLRSLPEWLAHDGDPQGLAQVAEQQARLAPFRPAIEAVAAQYSEWPTRGAGMTWPSLRERMRMGLEYYVLKHGRLPEGNALTIYEARTHFLSNKLIMHPRDFEVLRRFAPRED